MLIRHFTQFKLKTFQVNLKKGWNTQNFSNHFGLTEDQLYTQMCETFSEKTAQKLRRRMRSNPGVEILQEIHESVGSNMTLPVAAIQPPVTLPHVEETTEDVKSDDLTPLESRRDELEALISAEDEKLKMAKSAIDEIKNEAEKVKNELEAIAEKLKKFTSMLQEEEANISACEEEKEKLNTELREINKSIENLNKINVFISEDGTIEVESQKNLDTSYNNSNFLALISSEKSENFTVKELKALAKLMSILDSNSSVEFMIEKNELENLFDEVMDTIKQVNYVEV